MYYVEIDSPICPIILAGNEDGLEFLHLKTGEGKQDFKLGDEWILNPEFFKKTIHELTEYFQGSRKNFTVKLNPKGTEFQRKVWSALENIPYGETRSYKDIAIAVGNPKGARAIGMANNRNPIALIVPWHRVIGANGKLVGFAGGLDTKLKMLDFESSNNRID